MAKDHVVSAFLKTQASPFGPSRSAGVYGVFICDRNKKRPKLMYIGSSQNILSRVSNHKHPYRRLLDKYDKTDFIVYTTSYETQNYKEVEKYLISKLNPKLNKVYRNLYV